MKKDKIAIIGLGYVGLPLARLFATKFPVVGFDINSGRISELMSGLDATLEVDNETLKSVLVDDVSESNGLYCTNQLEKVKDCNYYIVTVPNQVRPKNLKHHIALQDTVYLNWDASSVMLLKKWPRPTYQINLHQILFKLVDAFWIGFSRVGKRLLY